MFYKTVCIQFEQRSLEYSKNKHDHKEHEQGQQKETLEGNVVKLFFEEG